MKVQLWGDLGSLLIYVSLNIVCGIVNLVQSKGRPFKVFTPLLVSVYNKLKEAGKDFEIIFVNCDKDEEAWRQQIADMPWIALPFKSPSIQLLAQSFDVSGKNDVHSAIICLQSDYMCRGNR